MIRKATWTNSEVKFIIENYRILTAREMSSSPVLKRRSTKSVLRKMEELRKKGIIDPLSPKDVKKRTRMRRKVDNFEDLLNGNSDGWFDGGSDDTDGLDDADGYETIDDDDDFEDLD